MAEDSIEGLKQLLKQFENLKNIDPVELASVGAYTLLAESQKLAPVKTGFLRNSGYVEEVPNKGANVVYGANYAYYVEYGTAKWAGVSFIRPAIDSKGDLMVSNMKSNLESQVKKQTGKEN
jgi:hypothetical protein